MDIGTLTSIGGRVLLAMLFVLAGISKIATPQPYLDHMAEFHIPGLLIYGVIALELGAGLALMFGYQVRWAALALGLFCILAAFVFHFDLGNKVERTMFLKDLALAGGLLAMSAAAMVRLAAA